MGQYKGRTEFTKRIITLFLFFQKDDSGFLFADHVHSPVTSSIITLLHRLPVLQEHISCIKHKFMETYIFGCK